MATKNPVPSSDYVDLRFNSGVLDEFLNSSSETFRDRLGNTKKTLKTITDGVATLAELEEAVGNAQQAEAAANASRDAAEASALSSSDNQQAAADFASAAQLASQQAQNYTTAALVGSSRNSQCIVNTASSTATLTADEVIVATALNGAHYRVPSISKTINLSTTGAGGMDTGTAPVNGYVAIYLVYNPSTTTSALLGVSITGTSVPEVYAGSNMPAGYTASALVGIWRVAASQLVPGLLRGRTIKFVFTTVVDLTAQASPSGASFSLSAVVPPGAKQAFVLVVNTASSATNTTLASVGSDSNLTGLLQGNGLSIASAYGAVDIINSQQLYRRSTVSAGTVNIQIYVNGYSF